MEGEDIIGFSANVVKLMLSNPMIKRNRKVSNMYVEGLGNAGISTGSREVFGHIVGQDPSDSKSNRFHVDIFSFCFHSFKVYSIIDFCKTIGKFLEVSNFNWLFLELKRFSCN